MRIVIEAQRIFRHNKHGMDFVVLEMIRALQKLDRNNTYVIAVGPGDDRCLEETDNFSVVMLNSSNYFIWEQILLPKLVKEQNADLLHCTSNTAPLWINVPLVLTLHDIIFLEKKIGNNASAYQNLGRLYRRWIVPKVLKKVKKVVTVSDYENQNIAKVFPELRQDIMTIYNGVSSAFRKLEHTDQSRFLAMKNESYWMLLGNTDPKKNLHNTLIAYSFYLRKSVFKRKLLIADLSSDRLETILKSLNLLDIRDSIMIREYISHDLLVEVYNEAFAFLYPSVRESFGLPLLEAMACGTPVITSNTSAIPEIAEENVVYIYPNDAHSITSGMLKLENDRALYHEMVRNGLQRSTYFDWNQTAAKTLDIYEKVYLSK